MAVAGRGSPTIGFELTNLSATRGQGHGQGAGLGRAGRRQRLPDRRDGDARQCAARAQRRARRDDDGHAARSSTTRPAGTISGDADHPRGALRDRPAGRSRGAELTGVRRKGQTCRPRPRSRPTRRSALFKLDIRVHARQPAVRHRAWGSNPNGRPTCASRGTTAAPIVIGEAGCRARHLFVRRQALRRSIAAWFISRAARCPIRRSTSRRRPRSTTSPRSSTSPAPASIRRSSSPRPRRCRRTRC